MSESKIAFYLHCRQCMDEKPSGVSPQDFAQIEAGLIDREHVQIWCKRHDVEIVTFKLAPGAVQ
jgi:hypothetical protein